MNEQAKSALAAWREANPNHKREVIDPIEKAKQNPNSKALAIKAKCWDCAGGSRQEVILCPAKECPLWNVRPWVKNTEE